MLTALRCTRPLSGSGRTTHCTTERTRFGGTHGKDSID